MTSSKSSFGTNHIRYNRHTRAGLIESPPTYPQRTCWAALGEREISLSDHACQVNDIKFLYTLPKLYYGQVVGFLKTKKNRFFFV